jgi:hypothetical protein
MQRWEYQCIYNTTGAVEPVTEWLNRLGAQGWELVTVEGGFFYFKRPARS